MKQWQDNLLSAFLIVTLITASFAGGFLFSTHKKLDKFNEQVMAGATNLPNLCYTTLQGTNYFIDSEYQITDNKEGKYIKLTYEGNRTIFSSKVLPTGSMRPSIPDHSTVLLVKPTNESDIKVGDIISVIRDLNKTDEPHLLHRVVSITYGIDNQTIYLTKGDNNAEDDLKAFNLTIPFNQINGKLVGVLY